MSAEEFHGRGHSYDCIGGAAAVWLAGWACLRLPVLMATTWADAARRNYMAVPIWWINSVSTVTVETRNWPETVWASVWRFGESS